MAIWDILYGPIDLGAINPIGIALDSNGTIWVNDSFSDNIINFDLVGTNLSSFNTPTIQPHSLAFDYSDDTLWYIQQVSTTIYHLSLTGTILTSWIHAALNNGNGITVAGGTNDEQYLRIVNFDNSFALRFEKNGTLNVGPQFSIPINNFNNFDYRRGTGTATDWKGEYFYTQFSPPLTVYYDGDSASAISSTTPSYTNPKGVAFDEDGFTFGKGNLWTIHGDTGDLLLLEIDGLAVDSLTQGYVGILI